MKVTEVYQELAAVVVRVGLALRADDKTLLSNGLALQEDAEKSLNRVDETHHLAFGDLNGFKAINDEHGHTVGDAVIGEAGRILHSLTVKSGVSGYRKSGDEFVLIIPDGHLADIIADLESHFKKCSLTVKDKTLEFSASFGICRMADADLETIQKRAEEACQVAKQSGGNAVVVVWTKELSLTQVERRFRCRACGTSTKCTMANTHVDTPLTCPVCKSPAGPESEEGAAN